MRGVFFKSLLFLFLSVGAFGQSRAIIGAINSRPEAQEQIPFTPTDIAPDFWLDWNGPHVSTQDNLGNIIDNITSSDVNAYVSVAESAGSTFKKPSRNGEGLWFNEFSAFRMGSNTSFRNINNGTPFVFYVSFKYFSQAQATTLRKIVSTNGTATTNSSNVGFFLANLNSAADPHTVRFAITNSAGGATGPFDVTCADNTLVDGQYNELKAVFTGTSLTVYVRNSSNPTFTQAGQDNTGSGLSSANTTSEMVVGVNATGFTGYLKHVAFWHRALTTDEATDMEAWLATETAQQITPTPVDVHLWWGQSNALPGSGTDNTTIASEFPELAPAAISNAYVFSPLVSSSAFTNKVNYWSQVRYNSITTANNHNWILRLAYELSQDGGYPYFIGCGRGSTGLLDKTGSIDWYADGGVFTNGDMYPNFETIITDGLNELLHVMRKTAVIKSIGQYQGENDTSDPAATSPAYRLAEENFIKSIKPHLNGLGYNTDDTKYYLFHPIFSGTKAADVIGDQAYVMENFNDDFPSDALGDMKAIVSSGFDFEDNHVTNTGASQAGLAAYDFLTTVPDITDIDITVRPDQYIGTNVSITAAPTGTITSWKWRVLHRYFHTSGRVDTLLHATSSSQNPSFDIDSTGFYDVQLIARNATDKYQVYETRKFQVFRPRVAQGSADFVVNVSSGSYYHDFGPDGDMSGKVIFMTGVGSNSQVEFRNLHADDPNNPCYIQKAADNTKVEFTFTGGSGKVWHFSQYAAGEGARNIVVNGFNLDGTPGIKVNAGASSTITIRVEGKLTNVGFYGVEVVSDPINIDGAAIAIVPTVGSTCNISNHETNNLHMWYCTITAGEEAGYFGESLQDPDYVGNNGFMPPQGTGIVMSRNTILGAGRDGLQSSLIGEGEDNYISNYGQQNGQPGEGGHQACLVSNDGSAMAWRRNYCINGEYFANIKSGLQPWASMSGQTIPQETILESNIYFAGSFPGTDQEPFAIYIQNNPESGAATWPVSIRNNTIYTDKKAVESLLALGGVSETLVLSNNIIIKTGNAGDYPEFNWTGNGNPSLIAGETVNNLVREVGSDLSDLYFADDATGDFSITNTSSAAYSGSPTNTGLTGFDYIGYPVPVPVLGYFFGAYSAFNLRTIAP